MADLHSAGHRRGVVCAPHAAAVEAGRAIVGSSTDHAFTSSDWGLKLTGCASSGAAIAVPNGLEKVKVAA